MANYSKWKVLKSVINYTGDDEEKIIEAKAAQEEYTKVSFWCDDNPYTIEDDGTYYKTVKIVVPEPTLEEKAERIRQQRNRYLEIYVDPYVSNPLRWSDMTEEEQQNIIDYRLYLLDIPEQPEFPDIEVKTFDEWKEN